MYFTDYMVNFKDLVRLCKDCHIHKAVYMWQNIDISHHLQKHDFKVIVMTGLENSTRALAMASRNSCIRVEFLICSSLRGSEIFSQN